MSEVTDITEGTLAKSDQLNAADLIGAPITITITKVTRETSAEQRFVFHYENDGGRPFKASKTALRQIKGVWGASVVDGWKGRKLTLYNDPRVKWAGTEVGGIRVSHMSHHPDRTVTLALPISRGKLGPHSTNPIPDEPKSQPIQKKQYTDDQLENDLPNMQKSLDEKRSTQQGFIEHLQKKFVLTDGQIKKILALKPSPAPEPEPEPDTPVQDQTETF